jgi:molybdopterin-guanine dinucleotide biosynthesis protein A
MQESATQGVPGTLHQTTGIVLAGGPGRRMGGIDKALASLGGRPMIKCVLERLAPQVDEILISANRNIEVYESYGLAVLPDDYGGYAGPLAGLHAGLRAARHDLVLSVPCDSPFLPADLAARLHAGLGDRDAAIARTGAQRHPVFALVRRSLLPQLERFLSSGARKAEAWFATLRTAEVDFDDEAGAFRNINSTQELAAP